MSGNVVNLAEFGEKVSFTRNPMPELMAARQTQKIEYGLIMAMEEHNLRSETVPCLVVMYEHIKGLIPIKETPFADKKQMRKQIGQVYPYKVIGLDKENNLAILSILQAQEQLKENTLKKIKVGQVIEAVVREVSFKGAVVDIGGLMAELPAQELSHGWVHDVRKILNVGNRLDVKVTAVDVMNEQVAVSVKELLPDPWPGVTERLKRGDERLGIVSGTPDYGYFVSIVGEPGVDALCKHLSRGRLEIGDKIVVRIERLDPKKKTVSVTFKKRA